MAIEVKTNPANPTHRIRPEKCALTATSPITTKTDPSTTIMFKVSQIGN
jgi:hypothetical protein